MMDIEVKEDKATNTAIFSIHKDFDYALAEPFEKAYQDCVVAKHYILDMSDVGYIDSSALGMLLNLREQAFSHGAKVSIINMNDVVLEIFRVLNFHKIFKPEYNSKNFRVVWVAEPEEKVV